MMSRRWTATTTANTTTIMRYKLRPRNNRLVVAVVSVWVLGCVFLYYYYYPATSTAAQCPGATSSSDDDILVVIRTGATEAPSKLPIHFTTTLRCAAHFVVYSDLEETIAGYPVRDVFAPKEAISEALRGSAEMGFYRHLRRLGREGLLRVQAQAQTQSSALLVEENPAWKLDRFKFLPMVAQALQYRPSAKWFVFIEADTYLVWENLVAYLRLFDAREPLYIGRHMYMNDVLFAHGGSGFVLSRPAMRRVVERINAHVARYEAYAKESAAGDMVLGRILADVNVRLFSAFPHFQGDAVTALDANVSKIDRRPWCHAPVTYHHMRKQEIRALWDLEQRWRVKSNAPLRHADVFRDFILPQLRRRVDDWDNFSLGNSNGDSDAAAVPSFEHCNAICEADPACLQFSYGTAIGKCATSTQVVLGEAATRQCVEYSSAAGRCVEWQGDDEGSSRTGTTSPGSVQSGWMVHRMQQYVKEMDAMCGGGKMDMWAV